MTGRAGRDTQGGPAFGPGGPRPMVIHALPVGGGILALAPLPGLGGDYRGDLDHVVHWEPAIVLALVTDAELVAGGAGGLGAAIQDRGTRWAHLPLAARAAPDAVFAEGWNAIAPRARGALAGGGRVLVLGDDGAARSGMIALRLMIECGEAPDEALARLRAMRPRALSNAPQKRWAMSATRRPVPFVRHSPAPG